MQNLKEKVRSAMGSSMENYLHEIVGSIEFEHGAMTDAEKDSAHKIATKVIERSLDYCDGDKMGKSNRAIKICRMIAKLETELEEFTVRCEKTNQSLSYWTATLIGADPCALNLAATGPSKRAAILAVLDMYVCQRRI